MPACAVAAELSRRLSSVFLDDAEGRRPVFGSHELFQVDPAWHDLIPFHEYFNGDTGSGVGASHQTGWTAVGSNVTFLRPGDFVVATVRRPGKSLYDAIGLQDMTTDTSYFERGINLRHGYLTEYYVEDEQFVVKIPQRLKDIGVLLEPMTVAQKGITQAYEIFCEVS